MCPLSPALSWRWNPFLPASWTGMCAGNGEEQRPLLWRDEEKEITVSHVGNRLETEFPQPIVGLLWKYPSRVICAHKHPTRHRLWRVKRDARMTLQKGQDFRVVLAPVKEIGRASC